MTTFSSPTVTIVEALIALERAASILHELDRGNAAHDCEMAAAGLKSFYYPYLEAAEAEDAEDPETIT